MPLKFFLVFFFLSYKSEERANVSGQPTLYSASESQTTIALPIFNRSPFQPVSEAIVEVKARPNLLTSLSLTLCWLHGVQGTWSPSGQPPPGHDTIPWAYGRRILVDVSMSFHTQCHKCLAGASLPNYIWMTLL